MKTNFIREYMHSGTYLPDNVVCASVFFEQIAYHDALYPLYGIDFDKSLKKAVNKRKSEFLAGRIVAGQALSKLNIENFKLAIGDKRAPLWPEGVKGSIAHSNDIALCVATVCPQTTGLGVDVEALFDEEKIHLASHFLFGEEYTAWLERYAELKDKQKKLQYLTVAFSVKEAFFKAAFPTVQEYFDFDTVKIQALCFDRGTVSLTVEKEEYKPLFKGCKIEVYFSISDGNCLSFCRLCQPVP